MVGRGEIPPTARKAYCFLSLIRKSPKYRIADQKKNLSSFTCLLLQRSKAFLHTHIVWAEIAFILFFRFD